MIPQAHHAAQPAPIGLHAHAPPAAVHVLTPALPENIGIVRHALGGLADTLEWDAAAFEDVKVAVTEACGNVVAHAYDGDGPGLLEVEAWVDGGRHVVVAVRDEGQRLGRRRESPNRGMGLGLPLITALTEAVEFTRRGARTEVRMTFRVDGAPPGRRARR